MERETKPLKLSNGDTVHFFKKLKGREYRLIKARTADAFILDSSANSQFKAGQYMNIIAKCIDILTEKIETKSGKSVEATLDYFDDLDIEDADKVYTELEATVSKAMPSKKK